jgi:N-acetylglucosamine kinase-like BadF-type ATPase
MKRYALGVDAGNTKTIALVADEHGAILGYGRAGCGDIYGAHSPAHAINAITAATDMALTHAGIVKASLTSCVFSAAGADWPEDHAYLRTALTAAGFAAPVVHNDAIGALRGGTTDGVGVVVACGTGAATGARNQDGRIWHSSFWQFVGGAGQLAETALRAVYDEALGFGPPTSLSAALLQHFDLPDVETLLHDLTARTRATPGEEETRFIHPALHGVPRVLMQAAQDGDAVARGIVEAHGRRLAAYALLAAQRVGLHNTPFTLVLSGGLLRERAGLLPGTLVAHVLSAHPDVHIARQVHEPAIGALLLALDALHSPGDARMLAAIERTLPPGALFAT